MDELKKFYNEISERQRYFFNAMKQKFEEYKQSEMDEFQKQEFEQNLFGLTQEEFDKMNITKKLAKEVMDELISKGVVMTAKEIIEGFEVV